MHLISIDELFINNLLYTDLQITERDLRQQAK